MIQFMAIVMSFLRCFAGIIICVPQSQEITGKQQHKATIFALKMMHIGHITVWASIGWKTSKFLRK